jgi:RNA polymerase sigma factor (sigma-70 family)
MPLPATQLAELIDSQAAALELWIGSRCDAPDDVVQEAFCRLAAAEPAPDNPVGWLYRVCRNLAEKQRRSDARRRRRELSRAEEQQPGGKAADPLELAEMLVAVERLDGDLREVLVARVWGQLSLEEVGRLCGVSTATAHRRYQSALETLRSQLAARSERPR